MEQPHPSEAELREYAVKGDRDEWIVQHLTRCKACVEKVDRMRLLASPVN